MEKENETESKNKTSEDITLKSIINKKNTFLTLTCIFLAISIILIISGITEESFGGAVALLLASITGTITIIFFILWYVSYAKYKTLKGESAHNAVRKNSMIWCYVLFILILLCLSLGLIDKARIGRISFPLLFVLIPADLVSLLIFIAASTKNQKEEIKKE
jgi:L-asparagine transporter-like permease